MLKHFKKFNRYLIEHNRKRDDGKSQKLKGRYTKNQQNSTDV